MIRKENIMKKIFLIPLMFLTFLSLTACSPTDDDLIVPETPEQPENPGNGNSDDNDPEEPTDPIPGGNGRYLVLFTGIVSQKINGLSSVTGDILYCSLHAVVIPNV